MEPCLDRVEAAFRKFDLDGDGVLTWDEFTQVLINCSFPLGRNGIGTGTADIQIM